MPLDQSLVARQAELKRLGFQLLHIEPKILIASRRSFYWDCMFTFVNYTVFVKRVETLSVQIMERDRPQFLSQAKELNPPKLPRGLQSGNAILIVYIADQVDSDAQQQCNKHLKLDFAQFYIPAALDLNCGTPFLFRKTPFWGAVYYIKFRYILTRLLFPQGTLNQEPLSTWGVTSMLLVCIYLVISLLIIILFILT